MLQKPYPLIVLILLLSTKWASAQDVPEHKPFSRWWWMGSAVNKDGIKYNLEAFQKAGIGGVEITPIYGVKGQEENFIPYLSDQWVEMLNYTTHTADSLNMKVDMVLGTGWPYGGQQVEPEFAASFLAVDSFFVDSGQMIQKNLSHSKPNFKLMYVLAFDKNNSYQNLTDLVQNNNFLYNNTGFAKTLYAIYNGKTAQKVKRAAPGGEGFTIDHYSKSALYDYLAPFNEKLKAPIRAIFNDSFEVYGSDFSEDFFEEFQKRRGYDLKPFLNLLIKKENSDKANKIRSDYRETLSDMLKENFDTPWTTWANQKGYKTKLQAHGSPGNLLDLYATADIPECETFGSMPFNIPGLRRETSDIREGDADPVMLKFSSSAAHVTGKPLVSSESFTWLRDHFKTALSQCKPELEELFLNGVNHVFFHGSTYSPPSVAWPGWKFYASVNFSPQMSIWHDAPAMFKYIKNCQSLLQKGSPDNEIAVYWPIYDIWSHHYDGNLCFQFKIHSLNEWLLNTSFYAMSNKLIKAGYSIDFLSDAFISNAKIENKKIIFKGSSYKAIVIPTTTNMPVKTLAKLKQLQNEGGTVIFENIPTTEPGYNLIAKTQFSDIRKDINSVDILKTLYSKNIVPEDLVNSGLKFIRRKTNTGTLYYIVNHQNKDFDAYLPLNTVSESVVLYDPDTEIKGKATINQKEGKTWVRLQLKAGKSIFLETDSNQISQYWKYISPDNNPIILSENSQIKFLEGGPKLPKNQSLTKLESWTTFNEDAESFSGTAEYTFEFKRPKTKSDGYILQLPDVRESAKIWLNGEYKGTLWANPFEIDLGTLNKKKNLLKIEVTNLSANRIRAKELAGEEWKIFYEINMVNKDYKPFDATKWEPMPSGIIGPLKLQSYNYEK